MTDQVRISDDGSLEIERTWDGEPLWSVETQQDELFAGDAFKQMPGQLPIEELDSCDDCSAPAMGHESVRALLLLPTGPAMKRSILRRSK